MKISLHLQIGMMYNYFNVLVSTSLLCSMVHQLYNGRGLEPE